MSLLRWICPLSVIGCILCLAPVSAEEPFGVKPLRPDSLAGWDHGAPPAGWTIEDGRLRGNRQSTPLLSGFSFGDFELRFQWSVSAGVCKVLFPEVPEGKGLELVLCEGEGCGRLIDGDQSLSSGQKIDPTADGTHTAAIRRVGAQVTVTVDDRRIAEVELPSLAAKATPGATGGATGVPPVPEKSTGETSGATGVPPVPEKSTGETPVAPGTMAPGERRFGLGLAVAEGEAGVADLRVQEPAGVALCNGHDLAGWWTPGNREAWAVENGSIVLCKRGGNYLRTEKEYANFTLSLEYKSQKGTNSGIGIRTPRNGWPSGDGMELQLWDRPPEQKLDKHQTMAIYGNVPPIARADKSQEWNRVVVKADGWMISAWVNGELVQQVNTLHHPELKHRNLSGWIGLQDHGSRIEFRNMTVLEAPPGTGLAAWNRPLPKRACTAVLDRLMNPERLSIDDGIRSAVAAKTVAGDPPGEHVLADLAGPGAIVRIVRTGDEGRLAFYFDGEETPRVECKPQDLGRALPALTEDAQPVLTFVGFAKSLKVVLREAKAADYRFDYVTFPADTPVETFCGPEAGFPHGWLSAIDYRHSQGDWGTLREHDPMPRFHSDQRTIEPGKTEPLIHLDGAGVVRWLRLRAKKQVLENNDLWLEVTVDGEDRPALATPVRFWFPGLAGQGNFHNFVMLERAGLVNRLAMPYGNGLTIALRNTGSQPIGGVSLSISYEMATDETRAEIAARMRLRGLFQPAQESAGELASYARPGRWVALVYQQPEGQTTAIDALVVDDQPRDGWPSTSLDGFLGKPGDYRSCLSGRRAGLCWRYLMLAPVDFQKSLALKSPPGPTGDRLAVFYTK